MLRTTDIDSGQPLLAEHCPHSATDFTTIICDFPGGTRSFALSANERARAVQSCGSLLESHGEDVVIELCIETDSGHEQVAEWIDNCIGDVIAGQEGRREQHLACGTQFGDHETKRPGHKGVPRRIGDDLSGCRDRSGPDLGAGGMDFRGFNSGWRSEINGGAGQKNISGRVDRYRSSTRVLTLQYELEDAVGIVFHG